MIDPDVEAFVADTERFYPSDSARRGLAEQRRLYDAYARAFGAVRPAGIVVRDTTLAVQGRRLALRHYRKAEHTRRGTIVYAHGGGFILGSLDSHDGVVARIADATGADVIAIEYRLAPEHPFPAAHDDVLAVIGAVARCATPWPEIAPRPLLLCGDSAGATLMASAALRLVGSDTALAGLVLVYPMLGREPACPARDEEADAPLLSLADVRFYRDTYLAGSEPEAGTFPLDAPSLAGLPPSFLCAAEHDPLRDDSTAFATRLRDAGILTELRVGPGLVHGFLRAIDRSPVAARAFDEMLAFAASRLDGS